MKNNQKILLSTSHLTGEEQKYIDRAFQGNEIGSFGQNIIGFEQDLENYLGANTHVAALSSGTAALHLALILAGVQRDDEVICQSMTFSASANPILYQCATPVFVDSELDTWNMCPNHLEEAIEDRINAGKKPKAVIMVHLYGMPAKMDEITSVCKKYDIFLIEDAAEALGSSYEGKACGTFGDISILSFNGNKIITTSGGGALVCMNKETKDKAIFLATQARDNAPHYQHSEVGYNYRMSNVLASIGRGQMEVLDKHVKLRRENNNFYKNIFKNIKGVTIFEEPNDNYFSNHWLSCIIIDKEIAGFSKEGLRLALLKENIESRPLWKPMHLQPIFQEYPFFGSVASETLFNTGLCLPSGSNLTKNEKALIVKTVLNYLNR